MSHQYPFKWRHFQPDIILLCVHWYVRYTLSSRDLEEMMLERGLSIDHTTSFRLPLSETCRRSGMGKIREESCPKRDPLTLFLCDGHMWWP